MMQTHEPGRRIVSKAEHVKHAMFKYGIASAGITSCLYGFYCVANLVRLWISRPGGIPAAAGMVILPGIALLVAGNVWLILVITRTARTIDTGIPVTRANTGDLSAPDSLVRASQEPAQIQEAVLLRAATQTQERHEEHLLRAAEGRE